MKLLSVIQWKSGNFTAGIITGKIIFKSESLIIENIKFTPYSDISQKGQIKDIEHYLTIDEWFTKRFDDIFGSEWPPEKIYNLKTNEIPYSIDAVSSSIKWEISDNGFATKIWVCSTTSQLGIWYDRRFIRNLK